MERPVAAPNRDVSRTGETAASSPGSSGQEHRAPAGANSSAANPRFKTRVRELLVGLFTHVYAAKAVTRFSLALIGCPVRVTAETPHVKARIGGVQLLIFSSAQGQQLRIDAYDDGELTATVFRPAGTDASGRATVRHFSAHLRRNDSFRLHVGRSDLRLERVPVRITQCRTRPDPCGESPIP